MSKPGEVIFNLIHGRYHSGWHWRPVQDELSRLGYESIAATLPVESGNINLDKHAEILSKAIGLDNETPVVQVAHSWGANVAIRVDESIPVKKNIFVAGAFHESSFRYAGRLGKIASSFHTVAYDAMQAVIKLKPDHPLDSVQQMAQATFYNRLGDEALLADAIDHLRPHPKRNYEPRMKKDFPNETPMEYVYLTHDMAINNGTQRQIAQRLGIAPIRFESDHTPMLSRAEEFAELIIRLGTQD